MGTIEDRWYRVDPDTGEKVPTERHGKGMRYRVRYRAPNGRQRNKSYPDKQKRHAERFLLGVENDKLQSRYVDPRRGRISLRTFGDEWLTHQTFDEATRERIESRLRVQIYPTLGDTLLSDLRPSDIQSWLRRLQRQGLSGRYRRLLLTNLSTILRAAVDDERIVKNPCDAASITTPRPEPKKVVPWTKKRVEDVRAALPKRYQIAVTLAAGCGLRQGEVFGLSPGDIDFEAGVVHVHRQVKKVRGRLVFALPKGRKARDVPLPSIVAKAIKQHLRDDPAQVVTLPWDLPDGKPVSVPLVLSEPHARPVDRNRFMEGAWIAALAALGVPRAPTNGMHALRHFYASVLLDGGENIRALAAYLGHADPGFTLRTYTHLMPTSEERTKKAIDRALGPDP